MPILGSIVKRAIELRGKMPAIFSTKDPETVQRRELRKLLRKAAPTAFGEHYGFSEMIRTNNLVAHFQQKVPLYDYNNIFRDWWFRSLNGEPFVCWPGRVKYFALSSGTSEASSKYIPVTN